MGTYMMSNDYQVSGRRIYQSQNDNNFLVYLHDWGPRAGMEWTFAPRLGTIHILRNTYRKVINLITYTALSFNVTKTVLVGPK